MELRVWFASFLEYFRRTTERPLERLREVGLREGMTFLDVGCSLGFYSFPASEIVGEKGRVIALDINPKLVGAVASKSERRGIRNIEAVVADAHETGIPHESADMVFMHLVLHDLDDKPRAMREFGRVLKGNGRLVVDEENVMPREEIREIAESWGFKFVRRSGDSTQIFEKAEQ